MAENPARPNELSAGEDVGREPDQALARLHLTARELLDALAERVRLRIRWVGPSRMLMGAGALLVLAGLGWWLLRSPALPTEAALPVVTHVSDVDAGQTTSVDAPPVVAAATSDAVGIVVVHVAGAVHEPGVYELTAGQRVAEAIAAAGGALPDAAPDALNLAAPVADGDRIEVPVAGAAAPEGGGHSHAPASGADGAAASTPIDLNEAAATELERLPGIGPATAAAIVEYRNQSGPFASVDDLLDVPGIGPAKLDAIRASVTT